MSAAHLSLHATWRSFLPLSTSFIISDQSGRLRGRDLCEDEINDALVSSPEICTYVCLDAGGSSLLELLERLLLRFAEHPLLAGRQWRRGRWWSLGHQRGQRRWRWNCNGNIWNGWLTAGFYRTPQIADEWSSNFFSYFLFVVFLACFLAYKSFSAACTRGY